jgi:hypothetical protein
MRAEFLAVSDTVFDRIVIVTQVVTGGVVAPNGYCVLQNVPGRSMFVAGIVMDTSRG